MRDAADTHAGTKALPDPIIKLAGRSNMLSVRIVALSSSPAPPRPRGADPGGGPRNHPGYVLSGFSLALGFEWRGNMLLRGVSISRGRATLPSTSSHRAMVNLHDLAGKGNLEGVRKFLRSSAAKVNQANRDGQTALHSAARG